MIAHKADAPFQSVHCTMLGKIYQWIELCSLSALQPVSFQIASPLADTGRPISRYCYEWAVAYLLLKFLVDDRNAAVGP
jgi:hypothetical protein